MRSYSWPEDHWHWPVELTHQHGVRSGDLIFTGGQADLNQSGEVVNPDLLDPQCRNVIRFVENILLDLDATLEHVVRWVVYFVGDAKDEAQILSLLDKATHKNCKPTVSTVCLPSLCYPGMRIELEAVAFCPEVNTDLSVQYARGEKLPFLPDGFSHAVRCGDLVFTSDCSSVSEEGDVQAPDNLIEQTHLMMKCVANTLDLVKTSLDEVLKLNVYYQGDGTASNWSEPARIRASHFPDPGPAATGIAVGSFAQTGLMTKISVTAGVSSGENTREFSWPQNHWNWTERLPYKHGNRFGRLIHLGGQVALNQNAEVLHPDDMVSQTRIAMRNIESVLKEFGATLDNVVKVTTFYQGSASAEALHENLLIRSASYTKPGPATSGIPVTNLVYQSMVIEIEVIAILDT